MLVMAGDVKDIPDIDNLMIFNFTSLNENIPRWGILPDLNVRIADEKEYDFMYANYIMNNDQVFINFFNMMWCYYNGNNIFILISREYSNIFDNLNESLFKFVQQRYGINIFEVTSSDDVYYLDESLCNMNVMGVYNFDMDKERFTRVMVQNDIDENGIEDCKKRYC